MDPRHVVFLVGIPKRGQFNDKIRTGLAIKNIAPLGVPGQKGDILVTRSYIF